jgi:hypothetical protein
MSDLPRQTLHYRPHLIGHKISSCVEDHTYLVLNNLESVILGSSIFKVLDIRLSGLQF